LSALTLRRWGVDQWLGNAVAWNLLLACSSADPLFLSWEWLTHWWQCYGGSLGRAPDILAFYRGEDLVGLAPLYHRRVMRGLRLAHSVVHDVRGPIGYGLQGLLIGERKR